jgi:(-)-alpha-terpineol synthase
MIVMKGESYTRRVNKLKEEVRMMLNKVVDPSNQLELIDILQKLGLSYHFEDEIKKLLKSMCDNISNNDTWDKEVLYVAALKFRLLRQHGYNVSQGNQRKPLLVHVKKKKKKRVVVLYLSILRF